MNKNKVSGGFDKTKAGRLAFCGMAAAAALALSYIEAVTPITAAVPVPGFKLGLANIAVAVVFFYISPSAAASVSAIRLLIVSLLFGGVVSFAYSAAGAAAAYAALWLSVPLCRAGLGWVGVCALGAAAHNMGQLAAAVFMFGAGAVSYAPWLLAVSTVTGALTGLLLSALSGRLERAGILSREAV